MNPAALIPIAIKTSIVLLVVGIGLHSRPRDAISLIRQPGLLFRSVLSMSVVMPLVAAGLVVAFRLPGEVNVALVALAMSPVPPLLPKKERRAVGDTSYGIGLSVTMALLAIITVPVTAAWLGNAFDREGTIAPLTVAKTILTTVLLPLAVGMALQRWMPGLATKVARPVAGFALALLVVSALPVLVSVWPAVAALFGSGAVIVLAAMAIIGLSVGHALGGPQGDDRTVLALSTTSRHPAVALSIAAAGGVSRQPALAAVFVYVIVAMLISVPYLAWRKRVSLHRISSAPL
jgi:BASS family bile acid:Na+ symporter